MKAKNFKQIRFAPEVYKRIQKTRSHKEFEMCSLTLVAHKLMCAGLDLFENKKQIADR